MIEKFCSYLTKRISKEMPELDKDRLEAINYGLQNIIGEIPKIFIVIAIGYLLGVGNLTLLSILLIGTYRSFAGGFHAKTHIGCITSTTLMFCGPAILAKYIDFQVNEIKYICIAILWMFAVIMIKLYAPADTENLPILRKKERKQKQILSYIIITSEILIAIFIKNTTISGIIIFGDFIQTLTITRIAYRVTHNKYGHEIYAES